MRYIGSRLKEYLNAKRGRYTELAQGMMKYRSPRKNSGKNEYNLDPFFDDDHNISLKLLNGLMRETGKPIEFFVDFEPGETSQTKMDGINGNNNIVNSTVTNDLTQKLDHLTEIIQLKDELIADKERIIASKNAEIEQWKNRYDDLVRRSTFGESDKNRT